ncbi:MAG: DUF1805 domain-containing protein [Thermoflavifilum sp.]|nr:DUF1805 domain-containing protein [Thermoflavifilum sp.]MCL6514439.1 DUF1805 domain-containing protein [Alicyclobacillus sp.]
MIELKPIWIDGEPFTAVEVALPKTHLMAITCDTGYVMCGALDVSLLRTRLADRGIVAARAVGVRTLDELLNGTVESCTQAAEALGIRPGMPVREALKRMKAAP